MGEGKELLGLRLPSVAGTPSYLNNNYMKIEVDVNLVLVASLSFRSAFSIVMMYL